MSEIEALQQVVRELRDPVTGCPWDRALKHADLKQTCVEEAAEVISGINILEETGNPEGLLEELGDLLLQIVMHAQIAEEEGLFNLDDICRTVREKMVRRHPHVFSDPASSGTRRSADAMQADQPEPVTEPLSWDAIKRQEKAGKEWMDAYLPGAMLEARELVDRARRRKGFLTQDGANKEAPVDEA